jgi:RimJ/RimL family protein N-acetyltransferase
LLLREHSASDSAVINGYADDPRFWRYLDAPLEAGCGEAFITSVLSQAKEEPRSAYNLAVVLKAKDLLIGSVRITVTSIKQRAGSLGYGFNPAYWGQGYASEAVGALVAFGFAELKLHRIYARCDTRNKASRRVMKKLGMTREGLLRETTFLEEAWRSDHLYSVLESESSGAGFFGIGCLEG